MKKGQVLGLAELGIVYLVAIVFTVIVSIVWDNSLVNVLFYMIPLIWLYFRIQKEEIKLNTWFQKLEGKNKTSIIIGGMYVVLLVILIRVLYTSVHPRWDKMPKFDLVYYIALCLLAPISEELIVRGYVIHELAIKHSTKMTIVLSALIFYLIHGDLTNIGAFIFGIITGNIMIKNRNLVPGMILHIIWNTNIYLGEYITQLMIR